MGTAAMPAMKLSPSTCAKMAGKVFLSSGALGIGSRIPGVFCSVMWFEIWQKLADSCFFFFLIHERFSAEWFSFQCNASQAMQIQRSIDPSRVLGS